MAAIVTTLLNVFTRLFDFLRFLWGLLAGFVEAVWLASIQLLQPFLNVVGSLLAVALKVSIDFVLLLITLALGLLPDMPVAPGIEGMGGIGQANRYIPIAEVMSFGVIWSGIFGMIGLYKLAKFIRGAG